MSTQADRMREKFRQEIRARQISQILRIQRSKLLMHTSDNNVFRSIDRRIRTCAEQPMDMQIVQQLIAILQKYPQQENTYILIGNYILWHNESCRYFGFRLLSMSEYGKKCENYKRAIFLLLSKSQQISGGLLEQFDKTISQILQSSTDADLAQNLSFLNYILHIKNVSKQDRYFPQSSMLEFFRKISIRNLRSLRPQIQFNVVAIMFNICQFHLATDVEAERIILQNHLPQILKVIQLGISDHTSYRSDFIQALKLISLDYYDHFENAFRTQIGAQLTQEILYIYQNVCSERTNLLSIFQCIITQFEFSLMLNMLSQGLHIVLVHSLTNEDQNHLHQSLSIIYQMLNRVRQKQETNLLNKILISMQKQKFEIYLENLTLTRQQPHVEKVINFIIDDYYSDQIA